MEVGEGKGRTIGDTDGGRGRQRTTRAGATSRRLWFPNMDKLTCWRSLLRAVPSSRNDSQGARRSIWRSTDKLISKLVVCTDFGVHLPLKLSNQIMQFWGAVYVIRDTDKWGNAHPEWGNARYGWEKQLFWKL